jgi:hypothetical protein
VVSNAASEAGSCVLNLRSGGQLYFAGNRARTQITNVQVPQSDIGAEAEDEDAMDRASTGVDYQARS